MFYYILIFSKYNFFIPIEIQWIQEDRVTLFTSEGLIQIGGSIVPRRFPASDVISLFLTIRID
jgi:hypothetical protein